MRPHLCPLQPTIHFIGDLGLPAVCDLGSMRGHVPWTHIPAPWGSGRVAPALGQSVCFASWAWVLRDPVMETDLIFICFLCCNSSIFLPSHHLPPPPPLLTFIEAVLGMSSLPLSTLKYIFLPSSFLFFLPSFISSYQASLLKWVNPLCPQLPSHGITTLQGFPVWAAAGALSLCTPSAC